MSLNSRTACVLNPTVTLAREVPGEAGRERGPGFGETGATGFQARQDSHEPLRSARLTNAHAGSNPAPALDQWKGGRR